MIEDEIIAGPKKDKVKFYQKTPPARIVDGALEDSRSSAALAKRIWTSLVSEGCDVLTVEDIKEVLPLHKKEDAEECFGILDENQNDDITLNEMVLAIIETGNARRSIYRGITDINHVIGTLDWIACVVLTMVVIAYMSTSFVFLARTMLNASSAPFCQEPTRPQGCNGSYSARPLLRVWPHAL